MLGGQIDQFDFNENGDSTPPLSPPSGMPPIAVDDADESSIEGELDPQNPASPRWFLIGLVICSAVGALAVGAFVWLMSIPPTPDCEAISGLSTDRERLYCAQHSAESGNLPELLAGIDLLEDWTPEHPLYHEAQDWLTDWSESVLAIARQKIYQNDFEGAVELANQIPPSSPIYDDAQAAIGEWQTQWQAGQAIYAQVQQAFQNQDWNGASQQILALSNLPHDYWRFDQATALSQQLQVEKRSQQELSKARNLARNGQVEQLSAAVTTVSNLDRSTHAWTEAQPELNQWSKALLSAGWHKWQAGKLDEAIALGRRAALNPNLSSTAQDLVKLSEARKLAFAAGSTWEVTPKHIWNMMEAIGLVHQIEPGSYFYRQAQVSLKSWETQLQDLTQLQVAQLAANLGKRSTLEYAIAQAQQVSAERPRRMQAQTLIAHWHQEVERIEDSPYLARAQQLARAKTIPALQAAIDYAKQIELGRPLRQEAQGLIFVWNQDIQTIEDQPYLDRAWVLARQGNLNEAILEASSIQPNRALYWQAQAAISGWQDEIQAAAAARRALLEQEADAATLAPDPEVKEDTAEKASRWTPAQPSASENQSPPLEPPTPESEVPPVEMAPEVEATPAPESANGEAEPIAVPLPDESSGELEPPAPIERTAPAEPVPLVEEAPAETGAPVQGSPAESTSQALPESSPAVTNP